MAEGCDAIVIISTANFMQEKPETHSRSCHGAKGLRKSMKIKLELVPELVQNWCNFCVRDTRHTKHIVTATESQMKVTTGYGKKPTNVI